MTTSSSNTFLSTGAFKATTLPEILAVCDALGFYNIELSSGLKWSERLEEEIEELGKKCRLLVHNYFPPPKVPFVLNLAARNAEILRLSREHCQKAVRLSASVGAPFFSVHSGFAFEVDASKLGRKLSDARRYSPEEAKKIFVESLQLLCEFGSSLNVDIAIENNVVASMNLVEGRNLLLLGATAEELTEIHSLVNKNNLGFLIDMGHLKVSANTLHFDPKEFLTAVKENITAFHLNDNDGLSDSNQMFNEHSWFVEDIRQFPLHYKVIESYRLTEEQLRQEILFARSL